jgi:hypothetical protein
MGLGESLVLPVVSIMLGPSKLSEGGTQRLVHDPDGGVEALASLAIRVDNSVHGWGRPSRDRMDNAEIA